MEKIIKIVSYVILIASVIVGSAYFYAEDFYQKMVAEDSPFEYATAFGLLFISILFIVRIVRFRKEKNVSWLVLSVFIALGAFFGFGEELSWGQRIFSIESGDFFLEMNKQAETNLHNLEINGVSVNKLVFSKLMVIVFGFYFVFAQLLYRKVEYFRQLTGSFGVPIPKIKHTVIMLLCTGFVLLVPEGRIWELWEVMFVLLLLLVFVEPYNSEEGVLGSVG